ncbi:MAG: pyrimidine-nucleoside phosphorylase [Candidatus Reconcilbacillus cellulovorans]|uniref:Pyrimidine-nucleoside phosphorylase n=1 Tax=Candidatus Reconcilbacillus cellulovorans TaxID=1906605 RepID=A0A2A6E0P8_9BACL|nr:MAG: pyrimidine-nucleoside phosphorylase [Candidatus Reconcilbacillus cellulovorans]
MRAVDLIRKKRDGGEHTREEIDFLIKGYVRGDIPDYQMAAWAMAVVWRGMTPAETAHLALAMAHSGETADWSAVGGTVVDKHSTGGVGDKTTLVVAPLVASLGVPVAKMSGRGLGHTGGTIDKLESIPGFRTEIGRDELLSIVRRHGVAVVAQSGDLAPADKKLYALRDVTATVESIPLIAASVMSKKIAAGAQAIVLDVKVGSGAFMKTLSEAEALARAMVRIGADVGRKTAAVLTSMDQPLGYAVGNALEVREAIDVLRGGGPADLRELCLRLGAQMVALAGAADDPDAALRLLEAALADGRALAKFREWVAAQGGDPAVADDPASLPSASRVRPVASPADGVVTAIDAEAVGRAAMLLGAGRETKDALVDAAAGVVLRRKRGDAVRAGETLAELHWNAAFDARAAEAERIVAGAFRIGDGPVEPEPVVYCIIDGSDSG